MIRFGSRNAFITLLLLASFGGSVATVRRLDRMRPHATLEEALYVPSATVLKRLSLGYNALLADVYWTPQGVASVRAVFLFGAALSVGFWGGPFIHALARDLFSGSRYKNAL